MSYNSKTFTLSALVLTVALCAGCDYMNLKDTNSIASPGLPTGGISGDPTSGENSAPGAQATFKQVYSQIIQPKCLSCHSGSASPTLSSWASFAQDTRYIIPGNPSQSDVYVQVETGRMPESGTPLTAAELQLLADWISDGAQNN